MFRLVCWQVTRDRLYNCIRFATQALGVVVSLYVATARLSAHVSWSVRDTNLVTGTDSSGGITVALRLAALALLASMGVHLGSRWFVRAERQLPLLPLTTRLPQLSLLCMRFPILNTTLVWALLAVLIALAAGPQELVVGGVEYVYSEYDSPNFITANGAVAGGYSYWLVIAFGVLVVVHGLIDYQRLTDEMQLQCTVLAFLFPRPHTSVQLILAGVYFYSGMSKALTYKAMAQWMFAPLHSVVRGVLQRISALRGTKPLAPKALDRIDRLVSLVAVLGEAYAGFVFGVCAIWPPAAAVGMGGLGGTNTTLGTIGVYALLSALLIICAMHSFIILYLGAGWRTWPIIAWNGGCAALSTVAFPSGAMALHAISGIPFNVYHFAVRALCSSSRLVFVVFMCLVPDTCVLCLAYCRAQIFALFCVYPASLWWGKCAFGEMAFSYYAHWGPDETLLVPKSVLAAYRHPTNGTPFPTTVLHTPLNVWSAEVDEADRCPPYSPLPDSASAPTTFRGVLDEFERLGIDLSAVCRELKLPAQSRAHAKDVLYQHTILLDTDWVDLEYEYRTSTSSPPAAASDRSDQWTYYNGPTSLGSRRLGAMLLLGAGAGSSHRPALPNPACVLMHTCLQALFPKRSVTSAFIPIRMS